MIFLLSAILTSCSAVLYGREADVNASNEQRSYRSNLQLMRSGIPLPQSVCAGQKTGLYFTSDKGSPLKSLSQNAVSFPPRTDTSITEAIQVREFFGGAMDDALGSSVSSAGDVNGDGYDDIIIGVERSDQAGVNSGAAYIYFCGENMDNIPDVVISGETAFIHFGYSVACAGDVNSDGYSDVIVGAFRFNSHQGRVYVYFGGQAMDNIADIVMTGETVGDHFGLSVAGLGDFNLDGYDDFIVGAPVQSSAYSYGGKAYVYFGSPNPDNIADLEINGIAVGSRMGESLAGVGDVNGDGFNDLAAILRTSNLAHVYFGSSVPDNIPDVLLNLGTFIPTYKYSVSGGDFNGDGFSDVITGTVQSAGVNGEANIFFGGTSMDGIADLSITHLEWQYEQFNTFAQSLSMSGDLNGDGYCDVVIGIPGNDELEEDAGKVAVYLGGPIPDNLVDAVFRGEADYDEFGNSVAFAGDINGDGIDDFLAGAWKNDDVAPEAGKAYLYTNTFNTTYLPNNTFAGENNSDNFGSSVSDAGDFNGDGYGDLISGAHAYGNNTGRAYIYFGGKFMDNYADLTLSGEGNQNYFAQSVSCAGDVNNDGYDDIVVGAYGYNSNAGRAYIYLGSASPDNVPDIILNGQISSAQFGFSVTGAGDVNNDGYADVLIGAYAYQSNLGSAYLFYGGTAMDNIPDVIFTGFNLGERFGFCVSGAGDLNGDSYGDIIIGSPGFSSGNGRAFIYYGGAVMNNGVDVLLNSLSPGSSFGSAVSSAGDVNGDGYADILVGAPTHGSFLYSEGRAYVFYGSQVMDNIHDISLSGTAGAFNSYFGFSLSDLGDFNGDGFSDFAVTETDGIVVRIYVHYGAVVPDNYADLLLASESPGEYQLNAPVAISSAGDTDKDGYTEIFAGFRKWNSFRGKANVYHYSDRGNDLHDYTLIGKNLNELAGYSVSSAGDLNGDGTPDIIIGYPKHSSERGMARILFVTNPIGIINQVEFYLFGNNTPGDHFGYSVSGAGDVNADGYDDVIVGAPFNDAGGVNAGRAYIYYGGPNMDDVADVVLQGQAAGDNFGLSVSSAGNVNGDNIGDIWADVIVGAPRNDAGGNNAGRAYVYYGDYAMDNIVDVILTGSTAGEEFGFSVSDAGDVNNDSFGDVIVGAYLYNNVGRIYIYHGSFLAMDNVPDKVVSGEAGNNYFGYSVSRAGKFNSDQYDDVIVGAPGNSNYFYGNSGAGYIIYGNSLTITRFTGFAPGDYFGNSVASAGDVNGDGLDDVVIGAIYNDDGGSNAGKVYVYYGNSSPINFNEPDVFYNGRNTNDWFGYSVAGGGDMNGDGRSDLIIGVPHYSKYYSLGGAMHVAYSVEPNELLLLNLKFIPQGFYDQSSKRLNSYDTLTVNLRSTSYPYPIIDRSKAVMNIRTFVAMFTFRNAPEGTYYVDVRHRNSIEVWSSSGLFFRRNVSFNEDFTASSAKIYGNNMKQVDNSPVRFGTYGGDVNQDGYVDATDALIVDNDISNFATGYLKSDANGDYSTDATDALIVDNNATIFAAKITP